jgi:hypothetical protein
MKDYFQYLSEQLKLPHPHTFVLRREYPKSYKGRPADPRKYIVHDVSELREGSKLVLMRNKDKLNPEDMQSNKTKAVSKDAFNAMLGVKDE